MPRFYLSLIFPKMRGNVKERRNGKVQMERLSSKPPTYHLPPALVRILTVSIPSRLVPQPGFEVMSEGKR